MNCHAQEFENKVVFTTTDRAVAALLLKVCEDANTTEEDDGSYHCQAWITVKK